VVSDELLNLCKRCVLDLCCCFREDLSNFSEVVKTDVLVAYILKNFTGEFFAFVTLCMDEVAEIASGAACETMEVFARNCSIVSRLDKLVWVRRRVKSKLSEF
jgi:hypothetical protein